MYARLSFLMLLAVPIGLQAQAPPNELLPPDDPVYSLAVDPGDYAGHDFVLLLDDGLAVIESVDGLRTRCVRPPRY